ncbi:hypothetical protein BDZ94DRAFT_1264109, partial [Collybia nuda]
MTSSRSLASCLVLSADPRPMILCCYYVCRIVCLMYGMSKVLNYMDISLHISV